MSKLTEIENKLIQIEATAFQQFGDEYLFYVEPGYPAIQRPGTQKGKSKSTKGHPDSYYRTAEGKYVLIEYTTQARVGKGNVLLAKIKEDILACWSEEQTGIPIDQVAKIIYCCTTNLNPAEQQEINVFARQWGIPFDIKDLKTLDTISLDVTNRFPWLAKKIGLSIDTEQLLPIRTFIQEYETSTFATPLTLPLVSRESEMDMLNEAIRRYPITFVTGLAGTGKTRLVLEALEQLQKSGLATCYCLSDKQRPIFDDLRSYLVDNGLYVLFLDDGNYQPEFLKQILFLLREHRTHPIKLVITVRNIAFPAIEQQCADYERTTILVGSLEDDAIQSILQGPPFHITLPLAIDHILSIAKGNSRLAVMAAKVAANSGTMGSLLDVSDLYHRYFDRAIDSSIWKSAEQLRVLGILSFFRAINLEDTDFCARLFLDFGFNRPSFVGVCRELVRFELLDADFLETSFHIGEQTLGAYFFYRTFIEEPLLDLSLLFHHYFASHTDRFQDVITSAYNTFGQDRVYDRIRPAMTVYWETIKHDEEKALRFFDSFWYCRTDELLHYLHEKIKRLPTPAVANFDYVNQITPSRRGFEEPWLSLLAKGYPYAWDVLGDFLDLSFAYVRKVPGEYPRLLANLKEAFAVGLNDEAEGFHKQLMFVNYLSSCGTSEEMVVRTFLLLAPILLKTNRQTSSWGRTRDTIRIRRFNLGLTDVLGSVRTGIWNYISAAPPLYTLHIITFLEDYCQSMVEAKPTVYQYDLDFLLPLLERTLSPDNFAHCCLVQHWIDTVTRIGAGHSELSGVQERFLSPTYRLYQRLWVDRLNGVDQYELPHDTAAFQALKEQEIRDHVPIPDFLAFRSFYKEYLTISEWEHSRRRNELGYALDVLMEQGLRNGKVGLAAFGEIIGAGNPTGYLPWRPFQFLTQHKPTQGYNELYAMIKDCQFAGKPKWIERLLSCTPVELITASQIDDLIDGYGQPGWDGYAACLEWKKYRTIEPAIFSRALCAIEETNRQRKGKIVLLPQFFSEEIDHVQEDMDLVKRAYLQQAEMAEHFDASYSALTAIVRQEPGFLADYLRFSRADWRRYRDHRGIAVVWTATTAEEAVEKAFEEGLNGEQSYKTQGFYPYLFNGVPPKEKDLAYAWLQRYMTKVKEDVGKMNIVLACVREGFEECWEETVKYFLSLNPDPTFFESLQWTKDSYVLRGNGIVSEVKAGEFRQLLTIIRGIKGRRYLYAQHQDYLQRQIDECEKRTAYERKERFMNRDF